MQMRLKLFHEAKAPLANGNRRDTLLFLSDEEFESNHGFIQWAFPTNEKSHHNFTAPTLDLESAVWLAENQEFVTFLENMTARFLEFLQRNRHWVQSHDHNHLRISRALKSIRMLHSYELANWFYERVLEFAGDAEQSMPKAYSIWEQKLSKTHNLSAGSFVGLAIGDALGAPVEFCGRGTFPEVTEYRSGGKFDLPAGAWTDDTAMSLCLAQSLIIKEGFDANDLLERFSKWLEFGENTSTGISVGVGQNTLRTLGAFRRNGTLVAEKIGSKNDGNGSLMRLTAVALYAKNSLEFARDLASLQSRTTHASDIADECCQFLADLICRLCQGQEYAAAKQFSMNHDWSYPLQSILETDYADSLPHGIKSSGYVVDTLQSALWAIENSNSFEEAVLKAVNLGDDADTVGAVVGQIAGAIYGYSTIPDKFKSGLKNERQLYVTSQFLC